MTPTCLDRPHSLSCLFFLSAVILSTLSSRQFLCVTVWTATIVHVSTHHFCAYSSASITCMCMYSYCRSKSACVFGTFTASLIVSLEKQTPAIILRTAPGTHLHQNILRACTFLTTSMSATHTLTHEHTSLQI